MKHIIFVRASALALLAMTSTAYAQATDTCPDGMTTGSCNITNIGDQTHDNSQTVGDSHDNVYSPDSASASASTGAIDVDAVGQGGTASSTATGNHSTNNNQSSANNSATNNMTNGSIDNNVTGGNITTQGGNIVQHGSADVTGGNAVTASGPASTNSGDITTTGGAGGAGGSVGNVKSGSTSSAVTGASTSTATGGKGGSASSNSAGGSVDRSGNSSSRSAVSGSGNSTNRNSTGNQTTRVDASNNSRYTYKEAARTAAPIMMPGYGPQNCYGDTNPSGSFGASVQTFGWGVTANSQKASNVCALTNVGAALERGGPGAALAAGYLSQMDRNAYNALSRTINPATGDYYIITPQETARRAKALEQAQRPAAPRQQALMCPDGFQLTTRDDGSYTCRKGGAVRVQGGVISATVEHSPPPGTVCPASHPVFVPGKGCRK